MKKSNKDDWREHVAPKIAKLKNYAKCMVEAEAKWFELENVDQLHVITLIYLLHLSQKLKERLSEKETITEASDYKVITHFYRSIEVIH